MRVILTLCMVVLLCVVPTVARAVDYSVRDLGFIGISTAYDINDLGQVVGLQIPYIGASPARGFEWSTQNGWQSYYSYFAHDAGAFGINNNGQVVGAALFPPQAILWEGPDFLAGLSSPSEAYAINNQGEIAGYLTTPSGEQFAKRWRSSQVDLEGLGRERFSMAFDINDSSTVVGIAGSSFADSHAVKWDEQGRITALQEPLGADRSRADGVNRDGWVAGNASRGPEERPFAWAPDGGIQGLDLLEGTDSGFAGGINDRRQIVGCCYEGVNYSADLSRATLWNPDGTLQQLPNLPGTHASEATAINYWSQIVGWSIDSSGIRHAVLWEPVVQPIPEPSTLALAAVCGLGGMIWRGRKR